MGLGSNIGAMMKIRTAWAKFTQNHPKFPMFLSDMQRNGIHEGTIIDIKITDVSGRVVETNLRVTASDIELFESLKDIKAGEE